MEAVRRHLPPGTAEYVAGLFAAEPLEAAGVEVSVVRARRSKLGDHRGPTSGRTAHRITVNEDLNPFAFLTTLLHEIAHAVTWERHERFRRRFARRVLPHGPQWKGEFGRILEPVLDDGLLPPDVAGALAHYLRNPRAATCSDRGLVVALSRYDIPDPVRVRVEEVPQGATFRVEGGRTFLKGPKLRSRFRCYEAGSNAEYRIHGLCRVEPCHAVPDAAIDVRLSHSRAVPHPADQASRGGKRRPTRLS